MFYIRLKLFQFFLSLSFFNAFASTFLALRVARGLFFHFILLFLPRISLPPSSAALSLRLELCEILNCSAMLPLSLSTRGKWVKIHFALWLRNRDVDDDGLGKVDAEKKSIEFDLYYIKMGVERAQSSLKAFITSTFSLALCFWQKRRMPFDGCKKGRPSSGN